VLDCRQAGRIANLACVIATGVHADGRREILGLDVLTSEDGAGWTAFLRCLVARGLWGVELVISDAHQGLVGANGAICGGGSPQRASRRCRTHFTPSILAKVVKPAQPFVARMVRSIVAQPDAEQVALKLAAGHRAARGAVRRRGPSSWSRRDPTSRPSPRSPSSTGDRPGATTPKERLMREVRRPTDLVGIFPNRAAIGRLVGAVLAEQHDQWAVARPSMGVESLPKARMRVIGGDGEEVRGELVARA